MTVVGRQQLDQWYYDELEELDRDLREGRISEKQYITYSRNIRDQYNDDLEEFFKND